jgi:hypothetical protein
MLTVGRIFAVAVCAMALTGCNRITEAKLLGTWRAEDEETVNEIACQRDHSFTSWTSWKNELTTPSVAIGAGDWKLHGHKLVVHFTRTVEVDSWSKEDKFISFPIVDIRGDALRMKNFDGSKILTYHRLSPDYVLAPMKRAPNDADFVGTWHIHYNTHDYEISFGQDHTCGDFAQIESVRKQFFTGIWRIDGNELVVDATSVPMFEGDSVSKSQLKWLVTGLETQRFAIKDGPISYCLERLK